MKLILGIFLLVTQYSFGQTYDYPKCYSQAETDLKIVKITRGDYSTTIDFQLVRTAQAIYVFLSAPNTDGAYYIKAEGKTYKLTSTNNIGNTNGITIANQNRPLNFSATFEAIPKSVTQFDLIEGGSTGSWHFYGISLNSSNISSNESKSSNSSSYSYPKKWDEDNLKEYWKNYGADEIEGIYIRSRKFVNYNGFGNSKTDNFVTQAVFYIVKKNNTYIMSSFDDDLYFYGTIQKVSGANKFFVSIDNYWSNNGLKTYGMYLTNSNELVLEDIIYNESEVSYGVTINRKAIISDKFSPVYKPEKKQEREQRIEINPKSSGTGYAISSNGYIATNHHVTNGASSIKVRGINGDFSKTYNAKVIIEDKNNDLSIIKIDDSNFTTLGTIPYIIASRASDVGSSVFVLGYPLRATMGDEVKLTNGIISSKSGFKGDVTSYQITAPVQPGNSGGPLFDEKGSIIGIINAKHVGAENASYAIKASYLMNLIDLMPTTPKLQTISTVAGKSLTEQVKILKKYTYIIEINQ
jgi:S1-C subfamily serine protease